jgi:Tol biopolymer transport system component
MVTHRAHVTALVVRATLALALLAALGAISVAGQGGPAPPVAPAGLSGRLLYTLGGALWTLNLADGQAAQIVAAPDRGMVTSARWSPDGRRVAYARYEVRDSRFPMSELWMAAADGSGASRLLAGEESGDFYQYPTWGPDGRQLYMLHTRQSATERILRVERLDVSTGQRETAIDIPGEFDVSPDGRWLALTRFLFGAVRIVLLDLATREQRDLVPERQFDVITGLRFDPTSQTLAFSAGREDATGSARPPASGRQPQLFSRSVAQAHGPPQDLYAVPIGGADPRPLARLEADEPVAAWSPDGAHLAVLSVESLSIMPAAGGAGTIVLAPGAYGSVDWTK